MSHDVRHTSFILHGATSVEYDQFNHRYAIVNPLRWEGVQYFDDDFIGISTFAPPKRSGSDPERRAAAMERLARAQARENPDYPEHHHHHGGMRCRSIILPSDEQHACAHCETVLPLGGRAYGVGSGAHVVPVCSLGCATEYARHGGSHHGG